METIQQKIARLQKDQAKQDMARLTKALATQKGNTTKDKINRLLLQQQLSDLKRGMAD